MELASIEEQRVLRWFGHVERMNEYRIPRKESMAKVSEGLVWGRQEVSLDRLCENGLGRQGVTVEAARQ